MKNQEKWDLYVEKNKTDYGKMCVDVAKEVMSLLDKDKTPLHKGYYPDPHTAHGLICIADKNIKVGSVSGFQAECIAQMIFDCHERGDEFRKNFNDN